MGLKCRVGAGCGIQKGGGGGLREKVTCTQGTSETGVAWAQA